VSPHTPAYAEVFAYAKASTYAADKSADKPVLYCRQVLLKGFARLPFITVIFRY